MICWPLPPALQRTHGNGKLFCLNSALACRCYDRNAHVRATLGLTRLLLVSLRANRFEAARREIFFFSSADSGFDKGMTRHATPARWLAGSDQRLSGESRRVFSGASGDAQEERRRPPCLPPRWKPRRQHLGGCRQMGTTAAAVSERHTCILPSVFLSRRV